MSLASALPVDGGQGCRVSSPTRRRCPGERSESGLFRWPGLPPPSMVASAGAGECRWRRPCPSMVARVAVFSAQPAAVALVNAGNLARRWWPGLPPPSWWPAPERVNIAGVGLARRWWPGLPPPSPVASARVNVAGVGLARRWWPRVAVFPAQPAAVALVNARNLALFRWPALPPPSPVASAGAGEHRWRRPCPSMVAKGCRRRLRWPAPERVNVAGVGLARRWWPRVAVFPAQPAAVALVNARNLACFGGQGCRRRPVASAGAGEHRWRRPCPSPVARVAVFPAQPAAVALVNAGNLARRWWPGLPPPSWWPAPERVNVAGVGLARLRWPGLPRFQPNPPRCPGERWEPCPFRWPGLPPASPG